MEDLKLIIAGNISLLRKKNHMTQTDLAQQLNYSDKAVSKWERGESLPDITVIKQIADTFDVSVDYLLSEHDKQEKIKIKNRLTKNKLNIIGLSVLGVWFIATVAFVLSWIAGKFPWILYVACVPASLIVLLVFNTIWGTRKNNFYIISLLIWSFLSFIYLLLLKYQIYMIFVIGVPAQIAVFLSFRFKLPKK